MSNVGTIQLNSFFQFNSIYFPKRNQAQEGCSDRPIGHLMSAAPNHIKKKDTDKKKFFCCRDATTP